LLEQYHVYTGGQKLPAIKGDFSILTKTPDYIHVDATKPAIDAIKQNFRVKRAVEQHWSPSLKNGYANNQDISDKVQAWHEQYPSITLPFSVGTSVRGVELVGIEISDKVRIIIVF
jgi:hypothetical protein